MTIQYKGGFKYQLEQKYIHLETGITSKHQGVVVDYIRLNKDGKLTILAGYAWDGPSGPAIDTKNFMRGALVHDALYQLMRKGEIDPFVWRKRADQLLREICREDGMSWIRAWWVYQSVRQFGYNAATRENQKPIITAP